MTLGARRSTAPRKPRTKRRSVKASWLSIISTSTTAPISRRSANRYTQYLFSPSTKRWLLAIAAAAALFCLYFFGLTDTGLLGPDEPRYAAIGRDMARSHDWITPRLWGEQWFEKPPLLYWMTAAGFACGLNEDMAPRLPVAAMSVAFLVFFGFAVRREFGERVAWFAGVILATSAGWLA